MKKTMKKFLVGGAVLIVLMFWTWQIFKPISVNTSETKAGEATAEISQPVSATNTISGDNVTIIRVNVRKKSTD